MNIEVLTNNTVKITLDNIDMTDYDVKYESLSQKSPDTKRLLIELLALVRLEKNLDLSSERLFIEAFPKDDGGCMLYISPLEKNIKSKNSLSIKKDTYQNSIICEIEGIDNLTSLCMQIRYCMGHLIYDSELYVKNTNYRLVLNSVNAGSFEDRILNIVKEYGVVIGRGKIIHARTTEYFNKITDKDAIEIIIKALA